MRRLHTLSAALLAAALFAAAAPARAQTEISITAAGAGTFPEGAVLLGLPLRSLSLGVGVAAAGSWATGQFQVTLTGTTPLGGERNIVLDGRANGGAPAPPGTASFSGTARLDPGDGTPPVSGVPFAAVLVANGDGTGNLTLTVGTTALPAAPIGEGWVTIE